ncbi:MAG TPA: hypothetical protein PK747_04450 [Acidobacteriota bacterium]|nr:hypothetical protein [Acidobacteriota bacterium]HQQ46644.1 hypothetical protein [Acidobacteriota bacterium]
MKKTLLLLLFMMAGCRPSPVNVAVMLPGNGSMDHLFRGVELAAAKMNAEGGIYGHIVSVERIAGGETIPGGTSAVILATGRREALDSAASASERLRVPVILVNPLRVNEKYRPGIVCLSRSALEEASFLGDFCAFSLHASKVMVLQEDPALAAAFEKGFCREGKTAVTISAKEAETFPARISNGLCSDDPPQAVFWASSKALPQEVSDILAKKLEGRALFVASASLLDPEGSFPVPTLAALPFFDGGKKAAGTVEFRANYKQRYGEKPSAWSAVGWEAMNLIKQSFESGAKSSEEMGGFVKDREVNFTLLGKLNFNGDRELMIPFDMASVRKKGVFPLKDLDRQVLVDLQEKVLACRYGKKDGKNTDSE